MVTISVRHLHAINNIAMDFDSQSSEMLEVSGIIDASSPLDNMDTLDEPVSETILRDLKQIGIKLKHVLFPTDSKQVLREWDLWGPLLLCLSLAISMSWGAPETQKSLVFAAVFVIIWCGAGLVTVNGALLGGNISFFQSVCVLGYCIFPLNIASVIGHFWSNQIFRSIVVLLAFAWSTKASVGFMAQLVPENRRSLGVYPVFLFYLTLSWMVFITD